MGNNRRQNTGTWPAVPPEHLAPHLILAYTSSFTPPHEHHNTMPGVGIYLVTRGRVRFVNPGFGTFATGPGDIVCIRPGRVASYHSGREPSRIYAAVFSPSSAKAYRKGVPHLPGFGGLPGKVHCSGQALDEAVQVYEMLFESMVAGRPTGELATSACLLNLVRIVFRLATGEAPPSLGSKGRWNRLLSMIESSREPLPVAELARAMGMTPRSFTRHFKQRFGTGPKQHIQRRHLWRGIHVLLEGKSVKEAAWAGGFSSAAYFSRLFSQVLGFPPSEAMHRREVLMNHPEALFPAGPLYFFGQGFGPKDFAPRS